MLGGLGAGVVLTSPKGDKLQYVLQMHFRASNNVVEYEALVHGLKLAKEIGIRRILCYGDSDLVVHQVSGEWDAKDANMASYRFYVQQLYGFFEGCEFHHVPRANNDEADRLSKIGSTKQDIPAGVSLEIIHKPSIKPSPESTSIFMPGDPAPAQAPPPDSGAAAFGLKEAAGQPSAAGSTKDSRLPSLDQSLQPANQVKPARRRTRGLLIPWSPVSSTYRRYHPGQSHSPTTSSLGTCLKMKRKLGDSNIARWRTPSSTANYTSAACLESSRNASSRRKE
jgi:ribonuclease HI